VSAAEEASVAVLGSFQFLLDENSLAIKPVARNILEIIRTHSELSFLAFVMENF